MDRNGAKIAATGRKLLQPTATRLPYAAKSYNKTASAPAALWDQEVAGSNPVTPTKLKKEALRRFRRTASPLRFLKFDVCGARLPWSAVLDGSFRESLQGLAELRIRRCEEGR